MIARDTIPPNLRDTGTTVDESWKRLAELLELTGGFWLGFIFSTTPRDSESLWLKTATLLESKGQRYSRKVLYEPHQFAHLLDWLVNDPEPASVNCVWVESIRSDSPGAPAQPFKDAWEQFFLRVNSKRDVLRARIQGGLVIAAPRTMKPLLREAAPDYWSVRTIVLDVAPSANDSDTAMTQLNLHSLTPSPNDLDRTMLQRNPHSDLSPHTLTPVTQHMTPGSKRPHPQRLHTAPPPAAEDLLQAIAAAARVTTRFSFTHAEQNRIESFLAEGRFEEAETHALSVLDRLHEDQLLDRAFAHQLVARVHEAKRDLRRALEQLALAIHAHERASAQYVPIEWYLNAARFSWLQDDTQRAKSFLVPALNESRRRVTQKETTESLRDLIMALQTLGQYKQFARQIEDVLSAFDEAVHVSRRLVDAHGETPENLYRLVTSLIGLGDARRNHGDLAIALAVFEETERHGRNICAMEKDSRWSLRLLSVGLNRLAGTHQKLGDLEKARALYSESVTLRRHVVAIKRDAESVEWLSSVLQKLSSIESLLGNMQYATELEKESVSLGAPLR